MSQSSSSEDDDATAVLLKTAQGKREDSVTDAKYHHDKTNVMDTAGARDESLQIQSGQIVSSIK